MDFFTSLQQQLAALQRLLGDTTGSIPERLHQLSDDDLQQALEIAASIEQQAARLRLAATSVLAQRANMRVHA